LGFNKVSLNTIRYSRKTLLHLLYNTNMATTSSSSSNEPLLKKKKKQCLGWIEWFSNESSQVIYITLCHYHQSIISLVLLLVLLVALVFKLQGTVLLPFWLKINSCRDDLLFVIFIFNKSMVDNARFILLSDEHFIGVWYVGLNMC